MGSWDGQLGWAVVLLGWFFGMGWFWDGLVLGWVVLGWVGIGMGWIRDGLFFGMGWFWDGLLLGWAVFWMGCCWDGLFSGWRASDCPQSGREGRDLKRDLGCAWTST